MEQMFVVSTRHLKFKEVSWICQAFCDFST